MFEKILISRCFLGDKVRYDGKSKPLIDPLIRQWQQEQRLVIICPEVSGGLSVPRSPAEIQPDTGRVVTRSGLDVTAQFKQGAEHALALCQLNNIRFALLKESSPSCGSTNIYDGSFSGRKIQGQGICSEYLEQHGIEIYSENTIAKLALKLQS